MKHTQPENLNTLTPKQIKKLHPKMYVELEVQATKHFKVQLQKRVEKAPKEVQLLVPKLDFASAKNLKEQLLKKWAKSRPNTLEKKEQEKELKKLPELGKLNDVLQPDTPLFLNPVYTDFLNRTKMIRLSSIAGFKETKIEKLLEEGISLEAISTKKLEVWVRSKKITQKEAVELGYTANLYSLLNNSMELTEAIKNHKDVKILPDLVRMELADWEALIKTSKTALPHDKDSSQFAVFLREKTENLFPETALNYRLRKGTDKDITKSIKGMQALFEKNKRVVGRNKFTELNTKGMTAAAVKKTRNFYSEVQTLVNKFPGFKLETIINDQTISPNQKEKQVKARIGLMDAFVKKNAEVHYLNLSYRHDSKDIEKLNLSGFKKDEKNMLLQALKSQQRVHTLTKKAAHTEAVMSVGFYSAFQILSVTKQQLEKSTGLPTKVVEELYKVSRSTVAATGSKVGTFIETHHKDTLGLNVDNTNPDIDDFLKEIPGYEDLFGKMTFCDCSHCQSIYSPAAYFIDLMQFVEKHVINEYFINGKESDVLNLKVRRRDLWALPLTCENTSTLVPYLDIINEILETFIKVDREDVYRDTLALENVTRNWKQKIHSFEQPFHLPLESISVYLSHFGKTRADIAILLEKPELEKSKTRLNLSEKEYLLLTKSEANNPSFLEQVYGIQFEKVTSSGDEIKPFDAQSLLHPIQVSRKDLEKLFACLFISKNSTINVAIKAEKKDADSVQNDIENIHGLTYGSLDRLHRFIRLWRKTDWEIEALDLFLSHFNLEINEASLVELGNVFHAQKVTDTSSEKTLALCYAIPNISFDNNEPSLLDRLFNHKDIITTEGSYPKDIVKLIHPGLALDRSTSNTEYSTHRLTAAFNCSDTDVLTLIKNLSTPLGINLDSPIEGDRGFFLTIENLSLLYRHVLLAEILKVSIADLFRIMDLILLEYVENTANIKATLDVYEWWESSQFSLDELFYIIKRDNVVDSTVFQSPLTIAESLVEQVETTNALLFAATVFAYLDNVTESQSKEIISNNENLFELLPDGENYQLTKNFNQDSIISLFKITNSGNVLIFSSNPPSQEDLKDLLQQYHPEHIVPVYLSESLQLSEEIIIVLIEKLEINLYAEGYLNQLNKVEESLVEIQALIKGLLPLSVLFQHKKCTKEVVSYLLDNLEILSISNINELTLENIQKLHGFLDFVVLDGETTNIHELSSVLLAFNDGNYKNAEPEALALILQTNTALLQTIHNNALHFTHAIDSLLFYKQLVDICTYIGLGGHSLQEITATSYDELNNAVNALLGAFRSKYKSEEEREEKLEKYQDLLRGKKRKALTNYLIHSDFPQFENENDLFHYFLIDVELEGCARTSRLVAATMSLQLYIHRILLNLEQDNQEIGTAERTHVLPKSIPSDEWIWRKNYRVWEANRKVFLYPENYIEPDLRDNKTPLFKELEGELLQQDINADTVIQAYGKYMRGFDELAHLKIAGSYLEKDEETQTDALHLFGVTAEEPPMYYYRKVDNTHYSEIRDDLGVVWNPWQKINVQIPVRKVSPIVFNGKLYVFWVSITTMPESKLVDNESKFMRYKHKFSIEFCTLKLDGTWSTPQKLDLRDNAPFSGEGVFYEENRTENEEPIEGYTIKNSLLNIVFPWSSDSSDNLILTGVIYRMNSFIDMYNLKLNESVLYQYYDNNPSLSNNIKVFYKGEDDQLFYGISKENFIGNIYLYCAVLVSNTKDHLYLNEIPNDFSAMRSNIALGEFITKLDNRCTVEVINEAYNNLIIDTQGDLLLLQGKPFTRNKFVLKRINTTLSETLTRTLFTSGVDTMLSIENQKKLKEAPLPLNRINEGLVENRVITNKIDYTGSFGTYYREIFFHIPFLIANHLNSQGKYAEAQKWYHYIFNPGANEVIDFDDPGLSAEQKEKMALDRNWQYLEFRQINVQKLRDMLTDATALEVYKKDPFNPHAIARLRMSAYQKTIVMKYIDNLLDWGDQLFARDTMESINEASLLYTIAREILGKRPVQMGDCGEGEIEPKTYESIMRGRLDNEEEQEFLIEMENYSVTESFSRTEVSHPLIFEPSILAAGNTLNLEEFTAVNNHRNTPIEVVEKPELGLSSSTMKGLDWKNESTYLERAGESTSFLSSLVRQITPIFCIPGNKDMLAYYDKVEDRLFKIRNCMNIKGQKRSLDLFAPEIDPKMLVRAKAAGLSLDDVLNASAGNLPPYRFAYILERAKAFTSIVQSFGASLLSAIERKDGEELTMLRLTQQKNILAMASKSRQLELDSAKESIKTIEDRVAALNYQITYYDNLIAKKRTVWEEAQSVGRHAASIIRGTEATVGTLAGLLHLIPETGSPFAMKYGGIALGNSASDFANSLSSLANLGDNIASSSGLEAGFDRRYKGWKHQRKLLSFDLKQASKNLIAAEIRRDILIESDKIYAQNVAHTEEVLEFYGEKFSTLGRYTWLSSTMQRMFKQAFNNALSVAKLAEQAYKYERDDTTIFIEGNYFESSKAGLLAGERLLMGLQTMERKYLETNYRKNEIDQAFSLMQIDPKALIKLKQNGECEFAIPEWFFDLFYPGQYKRKIKSVRLTIPSVTGPYTNISATLSLTGSDIRMEAKTGKDAKIPVPASRTTSISTSTAQNDAGVFQLNFRDDRYMPFEGAGAISAWKLSLPKSFRQFDYNTINDVILNISYTSEYDELFRDKIDIENDAIESSILKTLQNETLIRTFSLRQEFSSEFHRLTQQPLNESVSIKIEDKHFPFFLNRKELNVIEAELVIVSAKNIAVEDFKLGLNGKSIGDSLDPFSHNDELGGLPSEKITDAIPKAIKGDYKLSIIAGGTLAPESSTPGIEAAIDSEKLEDIIVVVKYSLS